MCTCKRGRVREGVCGRRVGWECILALVWKSGDNLRCRSSPSTLFDLRSLVCLWGLLFAPAYTTLNCSDDSTDSPVSPSHLPVAMLEFSVCISVSSIILFWKSENQLSIPVQQALSPLSQLPSLSLLYTLFNQLACLTSPCGPSKVYSQTFNWKEMPY